MTDIPEFVTTAAATSTMGEPPARRADGVWRSAWRRFRRDGVGMVAMAIVLAYALLIALTGSGLVARHWQDEVGAPDAPPSFLGAPAAVADLIALPGLAGAAHANVDISDVDPLAPRYKEWNERAAQYHAQLKP
ncbi:MAG: hypothetical protein ABJD97_05745, partial [Betaproteobacteria bacterium]